MIQVNPTVRLVVEYSKNAIKRQLNDINKKCANFEPWQIILLAVVGTYFILRIWDFYTDLENGKLVLELRRSI